MAIFTGNPPKILSKFQFFIILIKEKMRSRSFSHMYNLELHIYIFKHYLKNCKLLYTNLTLYTCIGGFRTTSANLFMFCDSVFLRLFRIFELHPALLTAFFIRVSFIPGSILYIESSVIPFVLGTIPLTILVCEPGRIVLGPLIGRRVQDRQSLRMSHVAGFADLEWLSTRTGRIGWQADEIIGSKIAQTETATLALSFAATGTGRTRNGAARS